MLTELNQELEEQGQGRLWEETSQPLEVPVTCKHSRGERGNPTASWTNGETETKTKRPRAHS